MLESARRDEGVLPLRSTSAHPLASRPPSPASGRRNAAPGRGAPDSGSAVPYENGGYRVFHDVAPALVHSRKDDPVQLCLIELPKDCTPGDNRGKTYSAKNIRAGATWALPDSEHSCKGP